MRPGTHVLSIAPNSALSVRVFVPEHQVARFKHDRTIIVEGLDGTEIAGRVRHIDPIPQELGFLREDDELPNGREKVFSVLADFADDVEGLSAGNDVRVRLP